MISDLRTIGPSDYRTLGLSNLRSIEQPPFHAVMTLIVTDSLDKPERSFDRVANSEPNLQNFLRIRMLILCSFTN